MSFSLGDVATEIEATRLLLYKAALLADKKVRHTAETASSKAFASQFLLKASNLPVERIFRDARTWVFAQGAPYVQRLISARSLLPELKVS